MTAPDPGSYAETWLSELGAYVPEWHDGSALAPRDPMFGLGLSRHERARRQGARLEREALSARTFRAAADPP